MKFTRTNYRQFEVEILGPLPRLGEVFTISHNDGRDWYEVECLEIDPVAKVALVERTDDGEALRGARSPVLAADGSHRVGGANRNGVGLENHRFGLEALRAVDEERKKGDVDLRCWCGAWVDDMGNCVDDVSHIVHPAVQSAVREERERWEQYSEANRNDGYCDDDYW